LREAQPLLDGERIGDDLLKNTFRNPPGVPVFPPTRSTLLVGARGSGKTTLLKHTEATERACAVYCDLRTVFNELSADTGAGGLSFDQIPQKTEGLIQDKAIALLMIAVSRKITTRLQLTADPYLSNALEHLWPNMPNGSNTSSEWIQRNVATFEPSKFRAKPNFQDLYDYLDAMHRLVEGKTRTGLLLLIDRAEEIPYPALTPIIQLLDQSRPFQAIVASRPGMIGLSTNLSFSLPRPGDHYAIYHLGASPYSDDWQSFQRKVMTAWIPRTLQEIPATALATILKVSRDSIRTALELAYNSLNEEGKFDPSRFNLAFENLQHSLLDAANGTARSIGIDLAHITKDIRKKYRNYRLPVKIRVTDLQKKTEQKQLTFLDDGGDTKMSPRLERFIRIGLRTWFFSTLHGESWSPNSVPEVVEINPIFLWYPSVKWMDEPTK